MKFNLRLRWLLMPVLIFVVLPLSVRRIVYSMVEKNALVSRPVSAETPQTHGVPFTRVKIPRGTYSLDAVLTKVSDAAPVVVIFHGSAESVSYWADVQAIFHKAGISTFVFDYSGFGNSGGEREGHRARRRRQGSVAGGGHRVPLLRAPRGTRVQPRYGFRRR